MALRPLVAPLVVAAVLAGATYAAAATTRRSGAASAAVSGYGVTDVHFQAAADAFGLVGVTFSLDPVPGPGAEAAVRLRPGGPWYSCRLERRVVCATPGATLATTDQLVVTVDG